MLMNIYDAHNYVLIQCRHLCRASSRKLHRRALDPAI